MLKPLTLSVSLAIALGASSLSLAGGHGGGCATCGIASPQGYVASPQSVVYEGGCDTCAPKKKCFNFKLPKMSFPKPVHTYEWVLKKKTSWHHAPKGCDTCGEAAVYPTSQVAPSGQVAPYAAPSGQGAPYGAPQHSGYAPAPAGQMTQAPGEMKPALAADEVPPAPTVANGSGLLRLTPSGN